MSAEEKGAGSKRAHTGTHDKGKKHKKQYIGGRGSGQVKAGKGFRTAGFDRLRQPHVRGVLISCDVRSEGLCVRESMMAVREHCSRRYPDLFKDDDDKDDDDDEESVDVVTNVEDAIAAEAAKEKEKIQKGPFGMIDTKTKGLLFIEFHNEKMDPVEICTDCLKEVRDTGRTKTKYLVRMTPVLSTSYAKYEDIIKAAQPLIDTYLSASMEPTTYCIVYKKRSNEDIDRLELIKKLADAVDKKHKVDLTMPKKAILIDIMVNVCCIGVCDDYFALRKYNVQELAAEGLKEAAKTGGESVLQGGRVSGQPPGQPQEKEDTTENKEKPDQPEDEKKKEEGGK